MDPWSTPTVSGSHADDHSKLLFEIYDSENFQYVPW